MIQCFPLRFFMWQTVWRRILWLTAYCDSFCRPMVKFFHSKIIGYLDIGLLWQFSLVPPVQQQRGGSCIGKLEYMPLLPFWTLLFFKLQDFLRIKFCPDLLTCWFGENQIVLTEYQWGPKVEQSLSKPRGDVNATSPDRPIRTKWRASIGSLSTSPPLMNFEFQSRSFWSSKKKPHTKCQMTHFQTKHRIHRALTGHSDHVHMNDGTQQTLPKIRYELRHRFFSLTWVRTPGPRTSAWPWRTWRRSCRPAAGSRSCTTARGSRCPPPPSAICRTAEAQCKCQFRRRFVICF